MKKLILLLLAFFSFQVCFAQSENSAEAPPMSTDRPSVGDASKVVPAGYFQLETGVMYQQDNTNFNKDKELNYGETTVRIGVLPIAELRLRGQLTHTVSKLRTNPESGKNGATGFDDV